jgi:phosphate transport system substrate-binding protein
MPLRRWKRHMDLEFKMRKGSMSYNRLLLVLAAMCALAFGVAACGDDDDDGGNGASASSNGDSGSLSGTVRADGSSTVAPLTELAAELFQEDNPDVRVTVGTSGTSGGFEKFCNGETEISDASRPIKEEEVAACGENGVKYEEVQVANDALSAVVNPKSPLTCISVESLNQIWDKGSKVDSWGDVEGLDAEVPDEKMTLFGPGSDSGTYDYWTEAINGEEGVIRTDYNSIGEDDNAAVNGVAGDEWAMAYIPYSFVQEAGDQVKALQIKNPDTGECVDPTLENVQAGTYVPLGRPLFIYPSEEALQKPEVVAFVKFYLDNQDAITTEASYIPMNEEQVAASHEKVDSLSAGGA